MSVQRTLQKYMDDWKRISHFDFCLLQEDNSILVTTCDRRLPAESKLEEFRNSTALCLSNATCCLYKITEKNEQLLLIVWGSEDSVSTIGELAVCQIESILESYAEKNDKNAFMQKLLLGDYTDVEAFNRARKLHISSFLKYYRRTLSFQSPHKPRSAHFGRYGYENMYMVRTYFSFQYFYAFSLAQFSQYLSYLFSMLFVKYFSVILCTKYDMILAFPFCMS